MDVIMKFAKPPYVTPCLVEFGSVRNLTGGSGTMSQKDATAGMRRI